MGRPYRSSGYWTLSGHGPGFDSLQDEDTSLCCKPLSGSSLLECFKSYMYLCREQNVSIWRRSFGKFTISKVSHLRWAFRKYKKKNTLVYLLMKTLTVLCITKRSNPVKNPYTLTPVVLAGLESLLAISVCFSTYTVAVVRIHLVVANAIDKRSPVFPGVS